MVVSSYKKLYKHLSLVVHRRLQRAIMLAAIQNEEQKARLRLRQEKIIVLAIVWRKGKRGLVPAIQKLQHKFRCL